MLRGALRRPAAGCEDGGEGESQGVWLVFVESAGDFWIRVIDDYEFVLGLVGEWCYRC